MQYCELHFTGREFTVFIHLSLLEALQKEIRHASSTPGAWSPSGLLLGRGSEGAAIVSSYAPQLGRNSPLDKEQFWKRFPSSLQKPVGQLEILGYYRVASGAELIPDEHDLRVMREFLPESASMLLLIGTSQGGNAGSAFVWEERDRRQLLASKTKVQFRDNPGTEAERRNYIRYREPASQPVDKPEQFGQQQTSDPRAPNLEKPPDGGLYDRPLPVAGNNRFRRVPRGVIHLVWILALCITAVALWYLTSNRQYRPKSSFRENSTQQKSKPLALAWSIENGRLRVTWDAKSPLLVSALSAVLSVNPEHGAPDINVLDRNQLMTGSAIFQLPPGRAKVRLVVFSEETSELAPRSDPAVVSRPLTAVTAASKTDPMPPSKENVLLPTGKFQTRNSRTSVDSPAAPLRMSSRKKSVEPMTVGFRDESWLDRFGEAQGEGVSGIAQISNYRVPPRPVRLIRPDRYYSLYPFTLDSVLIEVRVKINTLGAVTSAEPMSWGNALLNSLSSIAARAARESTFVPARFGNHNVPSTAILSYKFLRRK